MPCLFYLSIVVAVFLLCEELVIFDREREDRLYSTIPWVASLVLSYLPANVIFPVRPLSFLCSRLLLPSPFPSFLLSPFSSRRSVPLLTVHFRFTPQQTLYAVIVCVLPFSRDRFSLFF
jgi:hypothetical protein